MGNKFQQKIKIILLMGLNFIIFTTVTLLILQVRKAWTLKLNIQQQQIQEVDSGF